MEIKIEKLSDFESKTIEEKEQIARVFLREIIRKNTTTINAVFDEKFLDSVSDNAKKELFAFFASVFNDKFAWSANVDSDINDRKFPYRKYYNQYRQCASYTNETSGKDAYKKTIEYRVRKLKEKLAMTRNSEEQERTRKEISVVANLLDNPIQLTDKMNVIKKFFDNKMPNPIDMADIHTLACYIEYQNAFVKYCLTHQQKIEPNKESIKEFVYSFIKDSLTFKLTDSGYRAFNLNKKLPVIKNNEDKQAFINCLKKDGCSAMYIPSLFNTVGDYEFDFVSCSVKDDNGWQSLKDVKFHKSLKDVKLVYDEKFDESKQHKLGLHIMKTVLDECYKKVNECSKIKDKYQPLKILVYAKPLDLGKIHKDGLAYFDHVGDELAEIYAELSERHHEQEGLAKKIEREQTQEIDEHNQRYYETNYRTSIEDGEQMLVEIPGEPGLYVGNENGKLYDEENIIEIDTETDEHLIVPNPYYEPKDVEDKGDEQEREDDYDYYK